MGEKDEPESFSPHCSPALGLHCSPVMVQREAEGWSRKMDDAFASNYSEVFCGFELT